VQVVEQTVADGASSAEKASAAKQLGQPVGWPFNYTDTVTGKTYRNGQLVRDNGSGGQSLVDFFLTPEQQRQAQVKDMLRAEYAGVRIPLGEIETLAASPGSDIRLVPNTHPIETIWNLWGLFGAPENRGYSAWIMDVESEGVNYKLVFARIPSKDQPGGMVVGLVDVEVGPKGAGGDAAAAERYFGWVDDGLDLGDEAVKNFIVENVVVMGAAAALARAPAMLARLEAATARAASNSTGWRAAANGAGKFADAPLVI
jgi:hypothetical protein